LLSRLHRKAEALDEACLRLQFHPHDHAIRQELLSALEWEAALEPAHAPVILDLFREVKDHSAQLSQQIAAPAAPPVSDIERLRRSLAKLLHVLANRHKA
jgi:hypothetical protein